MSDTTTPAPDHLAAARKAAGDLVELLDAIDTDEASCDVLARALSPIVGACELIPQLASKGLHTRITKRASLTSPEEHDEIMKRWANRHKSASLSQDVHGLVAHFRKTAAHISPSRVAEELALLSRAHGAEAVPSVEDVLARIAG